MTSSTVSSESAPRSSIKEASDLTSSAETPSCSQTIQVTVLRFDSLFNLPIYINPSERLCIFKVKLLEPYIELIIWV